MSALPVKEHESVNRIAEALNQLRQMIRSYVLTQAGVVILLSFIGAFWIAGFLDYFPVVLGASESPRWARLILLILIAAGTIYLLIHLGWHKWKVSWNDSTLALLIERRFPEFQSSLITTVQSRDKKALADRLNGKLSGKLNSKLDSRTKSKSPGLDLQSIDASILQPDDPQLMLQTRQQALQTLENVDVKEVLRWSPLQWQAAALGGLLAVSALFAAWQPSWTWHWSQRLFGLSNLAWPRMASIRVDGLELDIPRFASELSPIRYNRTFEEGVVSIPRGQTARLLVSADLLAELVPTSCMLTYRGSDNRQGRASLRKLSINSSEKRQPFLLEGSPLDAIDQDLAFSLQGGDARVNGLRVFVKEPPQIIKLRLAVAYPGYLRRRSTSTWIDETIDYRSGLRLPEGTRVTLIGSSNIPLDRCECRITKQSVDGTPVVTDWTAKGDGERFELALEELRQPWSIEFRPWDSEGRCAIRVQQFVLGMLPDEIPKVDLAMDGIGTAITAQAILPFEGNVEDDHDIEGSWIDMVINESAVDKIPVVLSNDGKAKQSIDLRELVNSKAINVTPGQSISLTLVASDFCDLTKGMPTDTRLGRASPIQLGVVTRDQLLILLERRELAMRSRLELVISELNQMNELLAKIQASGSDPKAESKEETKTETQTVTNESNPAESNPVEANPVEAAAKLQLLRVQQSLSQTDKSSAELLGVAQEIGLISKELINNRVDSEDRQVRLEERVRKPMLAVVETPLVQMRSELVQMEADFNSKNVASLATLAAIKSLGNCITALEAILNDMADIQDFNELVDMVRGMIDDQGKIIDQTKQEQKKKVLDLFNQ